MSFASEFQIFASPKFIGKQTHKFIDEAAIQFIIINEGITMFKVIFYMAVVVRGQEKMDIVFPVFVSTWN